jgi:1,4-dihydroxy-2-naphthoate octaprenyltransferase
MKYVIGTMRPNFLLLAVACVFVAMAAAIWTHGQVNAWHAVLAFIGGLAAHACVNAINEYQDVKSGLDFRTNRTPFSGGSGTLIQDTSKAPIVLWTVIVTSLVAVLIGVYFSIVVGWLILAIGAIGLVVIFTYTQLINKQPLLCLIAPGFGFGTLMVIGSYYVLTGTITWTSVLTSFVPFFLVSNLLLLNQFPDVEADKTVARKHYPIMIGKKSSAVIYIAFLVATYFTIVLGMVVKLTPAWTLISLLTLVSAIPTARAVLKNAEDTPALIPSMIQNVLLNLVTPVLMGIGFLIA